MLSGLMSLIPQLHLNNLMNEIKIHYFNVNTDLLSICHLKLLPQFEVRELKFCVQTLHINTKNYLVDFLNFVLRVSLGFFQCYADGDRCKAR